MQQFIFDVEASFLPYNTVMVISTGSQMDSCFLPHHTVAIISTGSQMDCHLFRPYCSGYLYSQSNDSH